MYQHTDELERLAAQARRGDSSAAAALRHEMESGMVHMVRRTLRRGRGSTPIAERILTEARRISMDYWNEELTERERLVDLVTRRLCDAMIDRLQPAEAFDQASTWSPCETMCV